LKKEVEEIKKEIRHNNKRFTDSIEEGKKKEKNWEIRIRLVEDKIDELDRKIKELSEKVENKERGKRYNSEEEDERSEKSIGRRSSISRRSSSYGGSWKTNNSEDRFSAKEINKLRKMVLDKEKEERKNNIVIKGANPGGI